MGNQDNYIMYSYSTPKQGSDFEVSCLKVKTMTIIISSMNNTHKQLEKGKDGKLYAYLKKQVSGHPEGFDHPISQFVQEVQRHVVLLQINRQVCLVRLPGLPSSLHTPQMNQYKSSSQLK